MREKEFAITGKPIQQKSAKLAGHPPIDEVQAAAWG